MVPPQEIRLEVRRRVVASHLRNVFNLLLSDDKRLLLGASRVSSTMGAEKPLIFSEDVSVDGSNAGVVVGESIDLASAVVLICEHAPLRRLANSS